MYYENRMVQTQAELITRLNGHIQQLHAENDKLREENEKLRKPAAFYMALQTAIMKNETLQSQWVDLIMIAKLAGVETQGVDLPNIERPW